MASESDHEIELMSAGLYVFVGIPMLTTVYATGFVLLFM